jgi:hypothetical protein
MGLMPQPGHPGQQPNPEAARVLVLFLSLTAGLLGGGAFVGAMALVLLELLTEPRVVHDAQTLAEGVDTCVTIVPDRVDPANDGKLVSTTGQVTTDELLRDDLLGVSATALKLTRTVQIYQWVERRDAQRSGKPGRRTTTYTYHHTRRWAAQPVDAGKFHPDSATGQRPSNVGSLPLPSRTWYAKEIRLGGFKLAPRQVDRLSHEKLSVTRTMFASLPPEWKGRLRRSSGTLFMPLQPGGKAKGPQIGDVRITFQVVKPQTVSLIARQVGDTFEPWRLREGSNPIDEVRQGSVSQDAMFGDLKVRSPRPSWGLRLVGLCGAAFGLVLLVQPLAALRGYRPFVGGQSLVLSLLALLLAPSLVVLVHGGRWFFVERAASVLPLAVGVPACLLILGAGILVLRRRST